MSDARAPCPLCQSGPPRPFFKGGKASGFRDFLLCATCCLIFVPRSQLLERSAQKARYLQHNNDVRDPRYRRFLARLYDELKPCLQPGATGLDFGSGPGPALAAMMREDGFGASIYDPFFSPDTSVLKRVYDFITCTEAAEHFDNPAREFDRLDQMLRPQGWLGVMTGMLANWAAFPSWYYHRDPTHVNFFHRATMHWLARKYDWQVVFPRNNVVLFCKRANATNSRK